MFFAAFWIPYGQFLAANIIGHKVKNFSDTHSSLSHQFEHQAVSRLSGAEDNLVNDLFVQNIPMDRLARPEQLL